jgi:hypothetical protein
MGIEMVSACLTLGFGSIRDPFRLTALFGMIGKTKDVTVFETVGNDLGRPDIGLQNQGRASGNGRPRDIWILKATSKLATTWRAMPNMRGHRSRPDFAVTERRERAPTYAGALSSVFISLVVVVMNDRLAAIAVRVFLLDHGGPIAGLAFLDHRCTIAVAIMIAGFADRHACADRADANPDIIRKGRRRNDANHGGSQ